MHPRGHRQELHQRPPCRHRKVVRHRSISISISHNSLLALLLHHTLMGSGAAHVALLEDPCCTLAATLGHRHQGLASLVARARSHLSTFKTTALRHPLAMPGVHVHRHLHRAQQHQQQQASLQLRQRRVATV